MSRISVSITFLFIKSQYLLLSQTLLNLHFILYNSLRELVYAQCDGLTLLCSLDANEEQPEQLLSLGRAAPVTKQQGTH